MFLWDVSTGRTIRKFRGHDGVVNSVRPLSCGCSLPGLCHEDCSAIRAELSADIRASTGDEFPWLCSCMVILPAAETMNLTLCSSAWGQARRHLSREAMIRL